MRQSERGIRERSEFDLIPDVACNDYIIVINVYFTVSLRYIGPRTELGDKARKRQANAYRPTKSSWSGFTAHLLAAPSPTSHSTTSSAPSSSSSAQQPPTRPAHSHKDPVSAPRSPSGSRVSQSVRSPLSCSVPNLIQLEQQLQRQEWGLTDARLPHA